MNKESKRMLRMIHSGITRPRLPGDDDPIDPSKYESVESALARGVEITYCQPGDTGYPKHWNKASKSDRNRKREYKDHSPTYESVWGEAPQLHRN